LRAKVDYGTAEAKTPQGRIGVKVWVYHGDEVPYREQETERAMARAHARAARRERVDSPEDAGTTPPAVAGDSPAQADATPPPAEATGGGEA
jgi:small subunit ribosomal protein S3